MVSTCLFNAPTSTNLKQIAHTIVYACSLLERQQYNYINIVSRNKKKETERENGFFYYYVSLVNPIQGTYNPYQPMYEKCDYLLSHTVQENFRGGFSSCFMPCASNSICDRNVAGHLAHFICGKSQCIS